jgi:hypothetical protein
MNDALSGNVHRGAATGAPGADDNDLVLRSRLEIEAGLPGGLRHALRDAERTVQYQTILERP